MNVDREKSLLKLSDIDIWGRMVQVLPWGLFDGTRVRL